MTSPRRRTSKKKSSTAPQFSISRGPKTNTDTAQFKTYDPFAGRKNVEAKLKAEASTSAAPPIAEESPVDREPEGSPASSGNEMGEGPGDEQDGPKVNNTVVSTSFTVVHDSYTQFHVEAVGLSHRLR